MSRDEQIQTVKDMMAEIIVATVTAQTMATQEDYDWEEAAFEARNASELIGDLEQFCVNQAKQEDA